MKLIDLISEKDLQEAVLGEYEKRLVLYKFTNTLLKKKYSMSFEEFEKRNVIKEKEYSWEVEKDAMEWEHAIEGIRYIQDKICKIKTLKDGN